VPIRTPFSLESVHKKTAPGIRTPWAVTLSTGDSSPAKAATNMMEPEEALVADPRGGLTPVQVVELKLLTLLQTGNPGLFIQAGYAPQDMRMTAGKQLVPSLWCRVPAASLE
jgi:hypothetical protein